MGQFGDGNVSGLISSLLANDRDAVYEGKEPLVEPRGTIDELVQKGEFVMPELLPLIERYEREKEGRYYIEYVIEILGRVGGNKSTELILRILLASAKALIINDESESVGIKWLRELGRSAIPIMIRFVEENYDETYAVLSVAQAMEEIKDRRLVPLLVKLLKYKNPLVIQSALISLRKQNDESTIDEIVPLLRYHNRESRAEQMEVRKLALRALESLTLEENAN